MYFSRGWIWSLQWINNHPKGCVVGKGQSWCNARLADSGALTMTLCPYFSNLLQSVQSTYHHSDPCPVRDHSIASLLQGWVHSNLQRLKLNQSLFVYKRPSRIFLLTWTWPAIVFNRENYFNRSAAKSMDCREGFKLSEDEGWRRVWEKNEKEKKGGGDWSKQGNLGMHVRVKVREFAAISISYMRFSVSVLIYCFPTCWELERAASSTREWISGKVLPSCNKHNGLDERQKQEKIHWKECQIQKIRININGL